MLALVDGDVLAHICCPHRLMSGSGTIRIMPHKFYEYEWTAEEDESYLQICYKIFKNMYTKIADAVYAQDVLCAVKGPLEMRKNIYEFYKANRHKDPSKLNKFVPLVRKLAVKEGLAIEAPEGLEPDDLLNIWALQAREIGDEYVVISSDKDLDCIPGLHLNPKTKTENVYEKYVVSEFESVRFKYQQILQGDNVDNIPGLPGIGPVKAKNMLAGCFNELEMQEAVVEAFIEHYEDAWYAQLLSNVKMIVMQSAIYSPVTISDWPVVQELSGFKIGSQANTAVPWMIEKYAGGHHLNSAAAKPVIKVGPASEAIEAFDEGIPALKVPNIFKGIPPPSLTPPVVQLVAQPAVQPVIQQVVPSTTHFLVPPKKK